MKNVDRKVCRENFAGLFVETSPSLIPKKLHRKSIESPALDFDNFKSTKLKSMPMNSLN